MFYLFQGKQHEIKSAFDDQIPTVTVCSKENRKQMATVNYPNQETFHTGHGHNDDALTGLTGVKSTLTEGKDGH